MAVLVLVLVVLMGESCRVCVSAVSATLVGVSVVMPMIRGYSCHWRCCCFLFLYTFSVVVLDVVVLAVDVLVIVDVLVFVPVVVHVRS